MRRKCSCNQPMNLELHTVIFSKKLEIQNVPVFSCMSCSTYELLAPLKTQLSEYLKTVQLPKERRVVSFAEMNEAANLFYDLYKRKVNLDADNLIEIMETFKQERINLLLDVYQYAVQMNDESWTCDTQRRLEQLAELRLEEYFSEA